MKLLQFMFIIHNKEIYIVIVYYESLKQKKGDGIDCLASYY